MPAVDLSTIRGVRDAVASARASAVEVCIECLDAIGREDAALHAFNTVTAEQALARAASLDRLAASDRGPLARRPNRAQGQSVHARRSHDRIVQDPRRLHAALRRHGRRAPRAGRRNRHREDELRRVRDGVVERELGVRSRSQPLGPRPDPWRFERRLCGSSRPGPGPGRAGLGYGRLYPSARRALRHRGTQAHVRPRLTIWTDRVRLVAGSDWPADANGGRRRGAAPGAGRPRAIRETRLPPRTPVPDYARALTGDISQVRIGVPRGPLWRRRRRGRAQRRRAGARRLDAPGRHAHRRRAAARRLRDSGVLPGGDRRSELQPRAIRRRALRLPREGRRDASVDVFPDAGRGTRTGGQAAHHAGHLCVERGLLRRLLPESAARSAR